MADRTPDGLGLAHSEGNPEFSDSGIGLDSRFVRKTFQKFRILVVGKANSGKTTLLKKFCMSDEEPVVRDMSGRSISASLDPSAKRGLHDINHEISYPTSPGFVFHDSRGFESGGTAESKILYDFLENRSRRNKLHERIHAVWFCIPAGQARALGAAELEFFKHSAHGIPVIVIFTKWDVQIQHAINFLRHQGKTRQQAKEEAARFAEEYFARQLQDIQDSPNPPKSYVYLRDMDKDGADCAHLATVTAEALDDEVLRTLFVSKQLVSSKLSAEYAMRDIIPYGAAALAATTTKPAVLVAKEGGWFLWLTADAAGIADGIADAAAVGRDARIVARGMAMDVAIMMDVADVMAAAIDMVIHAIEPSVIEAICEALSIQDKTVSIASPSFVIMAAEVIVAGTSAPHTASLALEKRAHYILQCLRAKGHLDRMHSEIKDAWEQEEEWVKILKSLWRRNKDEYEKVVQAIVGIALKYTWDGKE